MASKTTGGPESNILKEVYDRLYRHFGPQHWWPGETRIEIVVGAILTQNTAWSNVEKAIRNLEENEALSFETLVDMPENTLADLIRPCGFFNVKAKRLKNLLRAVSAHENGDGLDGFLSQSQSRLRSALLSVSGVGPETADCIVLYAAEKPSFVVDAYTRRVLLRHGWISEKASYEDVRRLFMDRLPKDVRFYNEYHALWVALGKTYCRPKKRCSGCPLEDMASGAE